MGLVHKPRYQKLITRLRKARRDADMSQASVAAQLGQNQNFVSKCESGERRIDPIELLDFAKIYRKPVSYFLSGLEGKS